MLSLRRMVGPWLLLVLVGPGSTLSSVPSSNRMTQRRTPMMAAPKVHNCCVPHNFRRYRERSAVERMGKWAASVTGAAYFCLARSQVGSISARVDAAGQKCKAKGISYRNKFVAAPRTPSGHAAQKNTQFSEKRKKSECVGTWPCRSEMFFSLGGSAVGGGAVSRPPSCESERRERESRSHLSTTRAKAEPSRLASWPKTRTALSRVARDCGPWLSYLRAEESRGLCGGRGVPQNPVPRMR